jgi:hypothetical protein
MTTSRARPESGERLELIQKLEERFRHLSLVLYDTSVPPSRVDEEVTPYLAEDVTFVDPWQTAGGLARYRLGLAGFHCMFRFDFDIKQLNVQLDASGESGRAIVDGVMNLKLLSPLYTYPLRTILAYDFTVTAPGSGGDDARFRIHAHEEMWSFGDMIEALPLIGRVYSRLFRPGFSYAFIAASYLTCRARRLMPDFTPVARGAHGGNGATGSDPGVSVH